MSTALGAGKGIRRTACQLFRQDQLRASRLDVSTSVPERSVIPDRSTRLHMLVGLIENIS
jgi:hypothetical protein